MAVGQAIIFSNVTNPPETVKILVDEYHEDRRPYARWLQERRVYHDANTGQARLYAYLGAPERRATGHHWVYIYNEAEQKIAEVEYQVLP